MTELNITGMTCGHCVAAVKKALEAVDGVAHAEVELSSGRARVEGNAQPEALIQAVVREGYQAVAT
jgi:copper chaperone